MTVVGVTDVCWDLTADILGQQLPEGLDVLVVEVRDALDPLEEHV